MLCHLYILEFNFETWYRASENVYPGDKRFELGKTDIGWPRYALVCQHDQRDRNVIGVRKGLTVVVTCITLKAVDKTLTGFLLNERVVS